MKTLKTIVFWLLSLTWGIVSTLPGLLVGLTMLIIGKKPHKIGPCIYFYIGKNWGGFSMGPIFICCENCSEHTLLHEAGHAIQNIIWGPLALFIISIPSVTRYWLRRCDSRLAKSLFNLCIFLASLIVTTGLACISVFLIPNSKGLTITIEVLRLYFLLITIWVGAIELPKYDKGPVDYDAIWFEGQATRWGTKLFKK
jgi:hypothetical protein